MTDETVRVEGRWASLLKWANGRQPGFYPGLTPADAAIADASPALHAAVVPALDGIAERCGVTFAGQFADLRLRTLARAANWGPERRDGIDRRRSDARKEAPGD